MTAISIIHFSPIELYPPIINLLRELEKQEGQLKIVVITTANRAGLDKFVTQSHSIQILRMGAMGAGIGPIKRYLTYLAFFSSAFVHLLVTQPKRVLYFETISSWPAYIYKRYLNRKAEVFIHYHEYTSPAEYAGGMKLVRYFHTLEQWLYGRAAWVSHTNAYRLDKFEKDIGMKLNAVAAVLPNFPPRTWFRKPKAALGSPVRIIYAGALSMDTMFTEAFARWVTLQNGKVLWDIYSYNCTDSAKRFLSGLNSAYITLHQGVSYESLPSILGQYDVGVILYNGHIPNYVFNAPNKMFEYLACGLAVWFPDIMVGSLPYTTQDVYPEVVPLDFTRLHEYSPEQLTERQNKHERTSEFYCEEALTDLIKNLVKK